MGADRLANFFEASTKLMQVVARACGRSRLTDLEIGDLTTGKREMADLASFRPNALIVDVSCDRGLGFDFARPTTIAEPMLKAGAGVQYYAVDHTPSLLWRSATFEISRALLPYLPVVMGGPDAWAAEPAIDAATEIQDGHVRNPKILSFQGRAPSYPHAKDS